MSENRIAKFKLGELLVHQGVITDKQLTEALVMQKKMHRPLGDCLISLGFARDEDIADALEAQLGIPRIRLRGFKVDSELIGMFNGVILRKHNVLPLGYTDDSKRVIEVAMADPLNVNAMDDITLISGCMIEQKIGTTGEINAILDKYFGTGEVMGAAEQYAKEREEQLRLLEEQEVAQEAELENAPIVQLVRSVIEQAVRQRASDVHFDALEKQVRVRYRIDGVLSEKMLHDIKLLPAIVTRIKIMGGMDISEKRKPQDGRITMVIDKAEYDIRVSILPSTYGEKIVMRLASTVTFTKRKDQLGLQEHEIKVFDRILSNPNGIILVTGPTGSGKSTTLYTALSELNSEEVNIITVEDPVEASIAGINQVQVNNRANLTFATALRSILRQDPDIIMIGEIRDYETASIAVQASMTGHLVVSTLHTNSSAATITRLLDMGVESFLLADSIVGVIAQRLVRRLCPNCKVAVLADDYQKEELGCNKEDEITIYEPRGCAQCNDSGYYDRIGVYEIMEMTAELKYIISKKGFTEEIKAQAINNGMNTLKMSATKFVLEGVTSIKEMRKVSMEK